MADQVAHSSAGLRKDAIGLREALFQGITDMAPGAAIAASIPAGAALAGGSLPLSVVFALVACLLTASSVAELARNMPAAGGAGHVRRPGSAQDDRVPRRLGLRAGRRAHPAVGAAAAGLHHRGHPQR